MDTSLSWIKDYCLDLDVSPEEYVDRMTLTGTKVEGYKALDKDLDKIVTGHVLSVEKHPDADKLVVCQVDVGSEKLQIVTGAPNVKENDKVIVVLDGGNVAASHKDGEAEGGFKIKKGKLRGVMSEGMMCSIEELGRTKYEYPDACEDGIYILPPDTPVGIDAIKLLGLDDQVFEYEITSNRVDCYSVMGIAREAAATFNKEFKYPEIEESGNNEKASDYIDVEVKDADLCPRYIARVVKNVKIEPSPKWLRNRLASVGIRPINNVVDITNFVMEEFGQPMHAFDYDTLEGHKIVVKRAKDGEEFTTLDGESRKINSDTLMICDANKYVAMAGVMGGQNSMITDDVKTILFEAATFNGTNIRKTSKRVGLRTDASNKFEKGLDPNNALDAINRACYLIEKLGAGEVVGGMVDVCESLLEQRRIKFDENKVNNILGTNISKEEQLEYLKRVELEYDEKTGEIIVPTFRQDVERIADIAEEVARFYGYDKIPVTLPKTSDVNAGLSYKLEIEELVRNCVRYNGYSQAMCYSFESPKVFDKLLLPQDSWYRKAINIQNPLGEDFSIMRTISINGILTSLATNFNHRQKKVQLYELGNVYIPHDLPLAELPDEIMELTLGAYDSGDFFDLKGTIEDIFELLGARDRIYYDDSEPLPFLHPGRQARIIYDHKDIGYFGCVHPKVVKNYGMKGDVYIAVLHMPQLQEIADFDYKFKAITKYPAVNRDLSIVLDKDIPVLKIAEIFEQAAGKILESYKLFDYYEGKNVGENEKSVAYTLAFRAQDRTLEDTEIDKKIDKIVAKLSEIGASLRA